MRKTFLINSFVVAAFLVAIPSSSGADEHPLRLGFGADLGVPSGVAVGAVVHPKIDWASAQLSLTHNAINFGGRLSVKLDPLALRPNLPIGVFFDIQGGIAGHGNIPGTTGLPPVGYDYFNFYGGLRLGKPNGFHWNIEVGPTYMVAHTNNFQNYIGEVKNLTVSDPVVKAWLIPTFVTGFEVVFP